MGNLLDEYFSLLIDTISKMNTVVSIGKSGDKKLPSPIAGGQFPGIS